MPYMQIADWRDEESKNINQAKKNMTYMEIVD